MSIRFGILALAVSTLALGLPGCGEGGTTPATTTTPSTAPATSAVMSAPATTVAATPAAKVPLAPPPESIGGVKYDPVKYPQDTPEKALESLAKALEANEYAYQLAFLFTPDIAASLLEKKYKTLDEAASAAVNQTEAKIAQRKTLLKFIRDMQAAKMTSQGEINGVRVFQYKLGDSELIQLEFQPDGRWCMNPKARTAKK